MNNAYPDEFPELVENPPAIPDVNKLTRHILVEKPRVTKFQIDWEEDEINGQQNVGIAPQMPGMQNVDNAEIMAAGTQKIDRNDMMNMNNLAEAAQHFK